MKKAIVYTRTGDQGETSLIGGQRISKSAPRLDAYGTVDELGSHLGLLGTFLTDPADADTVLQIQRTLFHVGALLATPPQADAAPQSLPAETLEQLEHVIDQLEAALPPLRCFIIPGGSPAAAQVHVCRTVARRAERCIVALSAAEPVDANLLAYVNRLSDYLFVLARKLNFSAKIEEKSAF